MIAILDYGVGNIGSLLNMFRRIGRDAAVVSDPDDVAASDRLLLPGVGAFDVAARKLGALGLAEAVLSFAKTGRPLLGVCLGMQLLVDSSEEGDQRGLGLIPGTAVRFEGGPQLRVPHMGWNQLRPRKPSVLTDDLPPDHRFYFVHSYRVVVSNERDELARSYYGGEFTAMVNRDNITGAQFHPEKSHAFGMAMLDRWSVA